MKIEMNYVGIAKFTLKIDKKFKIGIDPSLLPSKDVEKRLIDPAYEKNTFENINLWLLTHSHWDHIDKMGIEKRKER